MQLSWRPRSGSDGLIVCLIAVLFSQGLGAKEGILGINDDRAIVETRRQLESSETLLNTNVSSVVFQANNFCILCCFAYSQPIDSTV
ncbi:hypothetical protein Gohar_011378 [Gossypium harknessii]|uniref:Uncharacterized protein n=1 Tax=Gossypium harknessii TaxID=34285 RepID=A0A7J9GTT0_9ROSI|nr:hypothetical protein [Gossypium harknessii]